MDDKSVERQRYDERARRALAASAATHASDASGLPPGDSRPAAERFGSAAIAPILRAPYLAYEEALRRVIAPSDRVLELGAGTGLHTQALLRTGAHVTATDISPNALALLARDLGPGAGDRLETRVADMERLPFENESFDVVVCAGSLSYGDPETVDAEVSRVLRPGGSFVCVDSLNHNPVYRFNRWVHFLRGHRSRSTLRRMPDMRRIASIGSHFERVQVRYFGGLTWVMSLVARAAGDQRAAALSDALDRRLRVTRSAFKFVLVASGRSKAHCEIIHPPTR